MFGGHEEERRAVPPATMIQVNAGGALQRALLFGTMCALATLGHSRASDAATSPAEEPARPGGKLDLKLKKPLAPTGIEGTWVYTPYSGASPYSISVHKNQGGFYQYEGRREGEDRPVLQFDRAEGGSLYRGEVGEGFDDCIPAGARFSLLPTGDDLVFEPSVAIENPMTRPLPGPCTDASHYFLAARGRGEDVRLRPQSELVGTSAPPDVRSEPAVAPPTSGRTSENSAAANVALGTPSAPDGTPVLLLGSIRDGNLKVWHHVKLLAPLAAAENVARDAAPGSGTDAGGAEGSADGGSEGGKRTGRPAGEDPGERRAKKSRAADPARRTKDAKEASEPPSGYVSAANVVMRWECRLVRVGARTGERGKETAP